jgi:hypothetical protein
VPVFTMVCNPFVHLEPFGGLQIDDTVSGLVHQRDVIGCIADKCGKARGSCCRALRMHATYSTLTLPPIDYLQPHGENRLRSWLGLRDGIVY